MLTIIVDCSHPVVKLTVTKSPFSCPKVDSFSTKFFIFRNRFETYVLESKFAAEIEKFPKFCETWSTLKV